jgi:DNA polymerase-3 subunit beta
MEFVIKQNVLKEELGFVQGIVEKKSTIPVLSNILIESIGENTIRFVGTDLDVTIRCEADADIKQSGSMCIQARKLFDIVRLLGDADVHFKKEENEWVKLTCGKSNFRLAGVSKDNFPEVPSFKSAPMKLSAEIFNHFINNTAFAITNEQSRFTLSGAKFMIDGTSAKMVTTDGHRLAFIEKNLPATAQADTMDALIPKKALMELLKIARDASGEVSFGEDPNHIYFEVAGRLLITRKLSGSFPNYEMVIPKDNDKTAVFDAEDMKHALRRVSLMADERTRSVKITLRTGEIEIGAQSSEEGEAHEIVAAEYTGEEVQIGFNSQYLQEFLNVATAKDADAAAAETEQETDGEKVKVKETASRQRIAFEFKDSNAQTQMNIAGDTAYTYKYIVMPLRI